MDSLINLSLSDASVTRAGNQEKIVDEDLIVQRAADILQVAYLDFRETTFDACIRKVEVRNDRLIAYDDPWQRGKFNGTFAKFPSHLVSNHKDKMALLCCMCCDEPYGYFKRVIEELLEGIRFALEEVFVRLKTPTRTTITVLGNGQVLANDYDHRLLKVMSKETKATWAIDVTGPQYDIFSVAIRWDKYFEKYCMDLKKRIPFGTGERHLRQKATLHGVGAVMYQVGVLAMDQVNQAKENWKNDIGITLTELVALDKSAYKKARSKLLRAFHSAVDKYVQTTDFTDKFQRGVHYDNMHPGVSDMEMRAIENS
ncbi:hypothetical protein P154DRAFT_611366 [Amniculicola lignicola CBS 123094]|uniref:Uncharacterized protein n=1 Tax=Amniculicola lignicola CBS 123094 TaxID=1392246 RepID=A0A6A5W4W6_9PLEO|nr:hypothetical protein P154DRAFT_611366 [Amniculicola lignicola CBS 123094]